MRTHLNAAASALLPLVFATFLCACTASVAAPAPTTTVAKADNSFGFKLFQRLAKKDAVKNLYVSPYSVATCLAMAYNGAAGETKTAMAHTLALDGISLESLNQASRSLSAALVKADPKVRIEIANSLWARQGLTLKPDFQRRTQQYYSATLRNVDFTSPRTTSIINEWVSQKTHGKIAQIVGRLSDEDVLLLVNAVYFLGTWSDPFDPKFTTQQPFHVPGGGSHPVPMMHNGGHYDYQENDRFQAIRLPYGRDRLAMYVFLPRPGVPLASVEQQLTPQNWQKWLGGFRSREGSIALPRFKVEYKANLNDTLDALGMGVAFNSGRANFSGMAAGAAERFFISSVVHKTYVKVDEKGTEAAAVTGVMVGATAMPVEQPFNMVCDQPFLSVIADRDTGAILFLGAVQNPVGG